MKNVVDLNGWVVIWDLDGCRFLTVYDTEQEAREFGENPKRQGETLFIGSAGDLVVQLTTNEDAAKATRDDEGRVAALANMSTWLMQTAGVDKYGDIKQLLVDAGLELLRSAHAAMSICRTIEEVREVAIAIREVSSPTNVIAADLYRRLQNIERDLTDCIVVDRG